jgi:HK97 family phage prohead protease
VRPRAHAIFADVRTRSTEDTFPSVSDRGYCVNFTAPLILRRAPTPDTGFFAGLASTWNVDRHGEKIVPGAFQKTLQAFNAGRQRIAVLHQHDPAQPIGAITSATETDEGLDVEGTIVLGVPVADRDHQLLLAGAAGLSVGFAANDADVQRDAQGINTYRSVDLMEVSVVGVPSNRESIAITVRSLASSSPADLERILREGELPPMPRRLAAHLTRAILGVLNEDESELDPGQLAALNAALASTLSNLKSR